jgi:two-component system sensor histidine kinase TtrS
MFWVMLGAPRLAQAAGAPGERVGESSEIFAVVVALGLLGWLLLRMRRLNTRLADTNVRLEQCESFVLDSVAEGVFGIDLSGRITFANRAFEEMTGWRGADLVGQERHELLHHTHADGEPYPRESCPIHATLEDGKARIVDDDLFWRSDGSWFPVEYSVTPLLDRRGQIMGSVVVIRDVTERRSLAERVRSLELQQAHAARINMLGEMVSGIGHELNQPLTAIATNARASLRLIESGRTQCADCTTVLDKIAVQAERAAEVIRHMRRFSRKEPTESARVAVADLFETVLVLMREDARRADAVLQSEIQPAALAVLAQQTQIEQVLINLARNGIEAMAEGGRERRVLLLQAHARGREEVEIRVVDTGLGLSRGLSQHLFEPFVTTKPQGIGLGLSISARIVETHGSHLQWETTPGIGTSFFFRLPRADTAARGLAGKEMDG